MKELIRKYLKAFTKSKTGESIECPFVIDCGNERDGVRMEYRILEELHGKQYVDWNNNLQRMVYHNDRAVDIMKIEFPDGSERIYYFDISSFFGKCK